MGRPHRAAEGGYVYHVLNRGNARMRVFDDDRDYDAFERLLAEAVERSEMRLLASCPTIGILSSGRGATASCRGSSAG